MTPVRRGNYRVERVSRGDAAPFILGIHYAKRWPSISYLYGLFVGHELLGVVSFGSPASAPLRRGIAGDEFAKDVIELNRLCFRTNVKNEASILVYQACNFTYTGLSAKRTDWKVKGMEHLHGQTIADRFKGQGRAQKMRELYGDDFYLAPRPRKHRYLFVHGSKSYRRRVSRALRYEAQSYPKQQGTEGRS